jgi:hypothetical protein
MSMFDFEAQESEPELLEDILETGSGSTGSRSAGTARAPAARSPRPASAGSASTGSTAARSGAGARPSGSGAGAGTASSRTATPPSTRSGSTAARSPQAGGASPRPGPARPPASGQPSGGGSGSRSGLPDFGRFIQQGMDYAQQGAQLFSTVSGIATALRTPPGPASQPGGAPPPDAPAPYPGAPPAPAPAPPVGDPAAALPPPGADAGRMAPPPPQPPPPPGMPYPGFGGGYGPFAQLGTFGGQLGLPMPPDRPGLPIGPGLSVAAPWGAPVPSLDATSLLALLLRNPQLQQAAQAIGTGGAPPRSLALPVPAPGNPTGARPLDLPLGAVMNAIALLASRSMEELNGLTSEDDPEVPEYMIGEEGEFLADPGSPEDRAALVVEWFRAAEEGGFAGGTLESEDTLDEAEAWARDAGLDA